LEAKDKILYFLALLEQSAKAKSYAPDATPEAVEQVIKFGHVHFESTYGIPGCLAETATVVMPVTHKVHQIQITVDKPGSKLNHLYCVTCNPKSSLYCVAAVAALIVKVSQKWLTADEKKQMDDTCPYPGCDHRALA